MQLFAMKPFTHTIFYFFYNCIREPPASVSRCSTCLPARQGFSNAYSGLKQQI
jgi:hypothetical protein